MRSSMGTVKTIVTYFDGSTRLRSCYIVLTLIFGIAFAIAAE